jgi:hypothetical protein
VDCCSNGKKLKFEIMHQHKVHPYFEDLAILAVMKNVANVPGITHQQEYRTESGQKNPTSKVVCFTFIA